MVYPYNGVGLSQEKERPPETHNTMNYILANVLYWESERDQTQKATWFHLHGMSYFWKKQNRNRSEVTETGGGNRDRVEKDIREFGGGVKLFYILAVHGYNDIVLSKHESFVKVDFILSILKKKKKPQVCCRSKGLCDEAGSWASKTLYCFPQGFLAVVICLLNSEGSYFPFKVECQ